MIRRFAFVCLAGSLLASQNLAHAQAKKDSDPQQKEIELLKRELELLKRENDLLKKEIELLKKGTPASKTDEEKDSVARITVDKVEYAYLGSERSGGNLVVTVLATSQDGNRQGPSGMMTIIDPDGEKYTGMPVGGVGALPNLREGVPVRLSWQFGGRNPITGEAKPSPSTKVTRFAGVFIQRGVGGMGDTIDFRNVPAQVTKTKKK